MSIKVFILLIVILVSGLFVYIKAQTLGSENSTFNQTTRYNLGKRPIVRKILGLHKDSDARSEFLAGNNPISIEVAQVVGGGLTQQAIDSFVIEVKKITGRDVHVYYVDGIKEGTLSSLDLDQISKVKMRNFEPESSQFLIIYANDFDSITDEVGRTYKEYGMVLSDAKLKNLTSGYSVSLPQYQLSTMLHEFGHQIGMDHNQLEGCIMNKEVESPKPADIFSSSFTPVEFCPSELDNIQSIKDKLR